MRAAEFRDLILLAALWGASFLFMRLGAGEFGPIALIELRVAIATLALLPFISLRKDLTSIRANALPLLIVGITNSSLPFYSTLTITAGTASILNATAPMFSTLVAFIWLKNRCSLRQFAGLVIGFLGIVLLVWKDLGLSSTPQLLPYIAGLGAALSYGIGGHYSKTHIPHLSPLVSATGSQLTASLVLLLPAIWLWPNQTPGAVSWIGVFALGIACTAFAYILYFRLIASAGAEHAITVTYLVPVFGIFWGALIIDEHVTLAMIEACSIILLGTVLATGVLRLPVTKKSTES